MLALVDHLEQQSAQNRLASYFNIDTLKYRVRQSSHCFYLLVLPATAATSTAVQRLYNQPSCLEFDLLITSHGTVK